MINHFGCLIVVHACQESCILHLYKLLRSLLFCFVLFFFAFADDMASWSKMIWRVIFCITISALAIKDRHEKSRVTKKVYIYISPQQQNVVLSVIEERKKRKKKTKNSWEY